MASDDHVSESSTPVDELIVRTLQGVASEAEAQLLHAWRAASPDNERYFRETERVWALRADLHSGRPGDQPRHAPTIHELTLRTRARPLRGAPPSVQRRGWGRRAGLAAAIVLGLLAGSLVMLRKHAHSAEDSGVEYVADGSETRTITLSDGTIVLLTPGSRLRVADGADREVWLDGRAYFAVPPRAPDQQFRVRTQAGVAVVLGTRFDLDARRHHMRLLVVEGKVKFAARGRALAVTANHIAQLGSSGPPVSEPVDTTYVQRELRWMRDYLVFTETPLDRVARELTRYYGVPVEVLDPSLAEQTVHAWFANEELEDVLEVICRPVQADCDIGPDRVTITSGGQP